MTLKQEITEATDKLEALWDKAIVARDSATGDEKRILRRITKGIDESFRLLEQVEEIAEKSIQ